MDFNPCEGQQSIKEQQEHDDCFGVKMGRSGWLRGSGLTLASTSDKVAGLHQVELSIVVLLKLR